MSFLEHIANTMGRTKGAFLKGVGDVFHMGALRPQLEDESAWINRDFWGPRLLTGKPVTKEQMVDRFTSWVYICASQTAERVAAAHLRLYTNAKPKNGKSYTTIKARPTTKRQRLWLQSNANLDHYFLKAGGGGTTGEVGAADDVQEVTDHPFLDVFKNVNPFFNRSDLMELTSMSLDLTGEAYWFIVKDEKLGVPIELWTIPSQYMDPMPDKQKIISGYKYDRKGVAPVIFAPEDIVMFKFANPKNPFRGMSCVKGVEDAIFTYSKMYEFEEALFQNRGNVDGILQSTQAISQQAVDRLARDWKEKFEGSGKAGKTPILPVGLEFVKTALTPQDMSFIQGRKITREEICIAFDVPIAALVATDVNRANAETAEYHYAKSGVLPRLRKIEEKINETIMPLYDESLFCAFDNPVPEDSKLALEENTAYVNGGVLTRNEVRNMLGVEPIDGGDELYISNLLVPLSQAAAPPPEQLPGGVRPVEPPVQQPAKLYEEVIEMVREKLA